MKRKLDYITTVDKIATHIIATADNEKMISYDVFIRFFNELKEDVNKLKLVKAICEEECNYLYMNKDIDVAYDHYSNDIDIVYLKENPETINQVTHADVKHIAERIKNEVSDRWHLGLLVSRPELCSWYTDDNEDDHEKEPLY